MIMEKFTECADYDSMGNCGRFPKTKKMKSSLLERFILFFKNVL
jgi:hypothetical protein